MKKLLIIKMSAAGDVIRTTPLLRAFPDYQIDWFVGKENADLLDFGVINRIFTTAHDIPNETAYDLVISLEDETDCIRNVFERIRYKEVFGTYLDRNGMLVYSENSRNWFDMSLVSRQGIEYANQAKLMNRRSYQEILFDGLGLKFQKEKYLVPLKFPGSLLSGDIAFAPNAGERWPMKNWGYYEELISRLQKQYRVNTLPIRKTLIEHMADIAGHKYVVSNDSLPMHLALGLNIPCTAFFICTSPWEIYDYGILTKIITPNLEKYYYRKDYDENAVREISLETAFGSIKKKLDEYDI